jgi:hypothetical protein
MRNEIFDKLLSVLVKIKKKKKKKKKPQLTIGPCTDEDKKKYFKIEKSHTAPTSASWSADAVKRRKIQSAARDAAQQRAWLVRNHIRRHEALRKDVVSSGMLARELAITGNQVRVAGSGDLASAAWARGAVDKGAVPFVPSFARARFANMPCFYVGGEDVKTGLGVAYASECFFLSLMS